MNQPRKTNECQVRANQKYRNKNREHYNKYQRDYLKKKYAEDPEFREKIRAKQRIYCARKKEEKRLEQLE